METIRSQEVHSIGGFYCQNGICGLESELPRFAGLWANAGPALGGGDSTCRYLPVTQCDPKLVKLEMAIRGLISSYV